MISMPSILSVYFHCVAPLVDPCYINPSQPSSRPPELIPTICSIRTKYTSHLPEPISRSLDLFFSLSYFCGISESSKHTRKARKTENWKKFCREKPHRETVACHHVTFCEWSDKEMPTGGKGRSPSISISISIDAIWNCHRYRYRYI